MKNIDDIIEKSLELRKKGKFVGDPLINTFFDNVGPLKNIKSGVGLIHDVKLGAFIAGFISEDENSPNSLNRLYEYMSNFKDAFTILEIINELIYSHSVSANYIIGTMISKIANNNNKINSVDLLTISALSEMYNHDIENLIILNKYYKSFFDSYEKNIQSKIIQETNILPINENFVKWCKNENIVLEESFDLTLKKCEYNQLLEIDLRNDSEYKGHFKRYIITSVGYNIFENIDKADQIDLLNDIS
jgi:hypothetical protein